jgi:hypothetical protein
LSTSSSTASSAGLSFVDFVIDGQHPLDSSSMASIRWTFLRQLRRRRPAPLDFPSSTLLSTASIRALVIDAGLSFVDFVVDGQLLWTFLRRLCHRRPASAGLVIDIQHPLDFPSSTSSSTASSAGLSFVDFVIDGQHLLDFPSSLSSSTASIRWT